MFIYKSIRLVVSGLVILMSCAAGVRGFAQLSKEVIELEPESREGLRVATEPESASAKNFEARLAQHPNFRAFADAHIGAQPEMKTLTLKFSAATKLTSITSTPDFRIEPGSQCMEGKSFEAGDTCTLLVSFTPKGAGNRLGKITVGNTASAKPLAVGLNGFGSAPVISFTPSVITTVPGTFVSNKGILSKATSLAVDGGDGLYAADTGNNAVRYLGAGSPLTTLSNYSLTYNLTDPQGIAVDNFDTLYITQDNPANLLLYYVDNAYNTYASGSTSCNYGMTCAFNGAPLYSPSGVANDGNGNIFIGMNELVAYQLVDGASEQDYIPLYVSQSFNGDSTTRPIAVDVSDNIYLFGNFNGACYLSSIPAYYAGSDSPAFNRYTLVAGGRSCGFSGDGGQGRGALIGSAVGQMAFDVAGNFYFTDTSNQRVRRIDAATGIINTIAGSGGAGWSGDGGPATSAQLSSPTGLAVDSQGQVYIISNAPAANSGQLIRMVGITGALSFSNQAVGTASAVKVLTVANTGNAVLDITKELLNIGNSGDFSLDQNTTSCNLTGSGTLAAGQSCKVGVIFKPAAAGLRSATMTLLDNTVTNSNLVTFSGTGVLPSATFKITSPAAGASFTSGTAVKFAVSVTSTGTAPTGTVTFSVDGKVYGSAVALASGAASTSVTGLSVASHTLSATYSGDASYAPGGPVSETIKVTAAAAKAKATVALSAVSSRTAFCPVNSWTATVAGSTSVEPTGTVRLMDGVKTLRSSDLSAGRAVMGELLLNVGSHLLTVEYGGDDNYAPATSPIYKEDENGCGRTVDSPVRVGSEAPVTLRHSEVQP